VTTSWETRSEAETVSIGIEFAKNLLPGSVVALFGELGTGKTRLVKGICIGLGVKENVLSPTFTIVNEYEGEKAKIYHFDFYRLARREELREIGFDEYLGGEGICLIEWADRVREYLPAGRYEAYLELGSEENIRQISIEEIVEASA